MLTKTESESPLQAVEVNHREDVGIADVWLRKNISETQYTNENGESITAYTADEVYFTHAYSDTLADELTASFDEWWDYGKKWTHEEQLSETQRQLKEANERMEMLEECLLEMSMMVYA